jgi:hypothetical protein
MDGKKHQDQNDNPEASPAARRFALDGGGTGRPPGMWRGPVVHPMFIGRLSDIDVSTPSSGTAPSIR